MRLPSFASVLVAAALVGGGGAPLASAEAQVGTIAIQGPTLSPVGLWQGATAPNVTAAAANTLSIQVTSGATQSIASVTDNARNAFPTPVGITTQWDLTTIVNRVELVAYFASPSAAMTAGASTIPSSRILGRMLTGSPTTYTPFTGNSVSGIGTPGASLSLFVEKVIAPRNGNGQRTDNLELQLDLRGITTLATGTYVGTLTLRAISY